MRSGLVISFNSSAINGMKCVTVTVTHHFHGPTHNPQVSAEIVYLADGKPLGQVTVDDFNNNDLTELANNLVNEVEKEFAKHISAEGLNKDITQKRESIKGLVKEF